MRFFRVSRHIRTLGLGLPLVLAVAPVGADTAGTHWRDDQNLKVTNQEWLADSEYGSQVQGILDEYSSSARAVGEDATPYRDPASNVAVRMPGTFEPWWNDAATQSLVPQAQPAMETLQNLYVRAVQNSNQIKVFADLPVIRETAELEARGEFDWTAFADYRLTDLDRPSGSTLTTSEADRLLEDEWNFRAGIRKKLITGTEVELSQRWGVLDNNSTFLRPPDQANTRLAISVTQPLLNGLGIAYNRSTIDVARLDGSAALDEFERQVEGHLLAIARAYWTLYRERAQLLQRRRLVNDTRQLVQDMESRSGVDVLPSEVARARAELATFRAQVVRAEAAIRNAEARLIALVNDPELRIDRQFELVPVNAPVTMPPLADQVSTRRAMELALINRPEVDQAFKQMRAALIRTDTSRRELLPVLNLVAEYYRDGLAGDRDTSQAFDNQFDDGDGSYVLGLVFEYPLQNRAAKARHRRRQVELRQLTSQLRSTLDTMSVEVQVATREVRIAHREMQSNYAAMVANRKELETLNERSELNESTASAHFERLLDGYDRLADTEARFLDAQVTYNLALVNLDRATGMLLQSTRITPRREERDGLPAYGFDVPPGSG